MKKTLLTLFAFALAATAATAQTSVAEVNHLNLTHPDFTESRIKAEPTTMFKAPGVSRADEQTESFNFTLAHEVYTALGLNNIAAGTEIHTAFEFSAENCAKYNGKTITAINVCTGVNGTTKRNAITDVTVYLMDDFGEEPFLTQTGKLGTNPYTYYSVELDTPFTIDTNAHKSFVVGCSFKTKSATDYYIVVDGMPHNGDEGGYYGYKTSAGVKWSNLASAYGFICLGATIEGTGFEQNTMDMFTVIPPDYVEPGKSFTAMFAATNTAANNVNSLELEVKVGNGNPVVMPVTLQQGLPYNMMCAYNINDIICNDEGSNIPLTFTVTKVNGVENTSANKSMTVGITCFDKSKGYDRRHVLEEGTGTWCGWCPAGIVMMEYVKAKYPNDFIRIAVHSGSQSASDPMTSSSTSTVLNYFEGFPSAMIDRTTDIYPTDPDVLSSIDEFYEAQKEIPALVGVTDIAATVNGYTVNIESKVKFALDIENNDRYRMAYYITEDNVGPYNQTNYYAPSYAAQTGGAKLAGWDDKPSPVSTMYDDVARLLIGRNTGFTNSLPAKIEAGAEYSYSTSGSITAVKGNDFYITALVIDNETNSIANAGQILINKQGTAIEDIDETSTLTIAGGNGTIAINGEYTEARVYNIAGQLVATAAGEPNVTVPAGLYIVKADGTTAKVVVR